MVFTLLFVCVHSTEAQAADGEIDCSKAMKVTWTAVNELSSAIPGLGVIVKLIQGISKTVSHSSCTVPSGQRVPTVEEMIKEIERISGERIDDNERRQLQRDADDLLATFEGELTALGNAENLSESEEQRLSFLMQTIGNDASRAESQAQEIGWPALPAIATIAAIKNAAFVLAYELAEPGQYRDHLLSTVIPQERAESIELVKLKEAEYLEFVGESTLYRFATESHGVDYRPLQIEVRVKRGPDRYEYQRSWYCERSVFNPSACQEFTRLRDQYFAEGLAAYRKVRKGLMEALGIDYLSSRNEFNLGGRPHLVDTRPQFLVNQNRPPGEPTLCLGVDGDPETEIGDRVDLTPCEFDQAAEYAPYPDQLWRIVPGTGMIKNLNSDLCLEESPRPAGQSVSFVGVQVCEEGQQDDFSDQNWGLHPAGYLVNLETGRCLDVYPDPVVSGPGAEECQFWLDSFSVGGGSTMQQWSPRYLTMPGIDPDSGDSPPEGGLGALARRPGTAGCTSVGGSLGECASGIALREASDLVVAPDGAQVYSVSQGSDAVTVFDRNRNSGSLTQKNVPEGCVAVLTHSGNCRSGVGLDGAVAVAISPDGMNVYVAARASNAVTVFDRDPVLGTLRQKAGKAGCIAEIGTSFCADGEALNGARSIVISPDGRHVYVASENSDSVAIFGRNQNTGALTQKTGISGCISHSGTGGKCVKGTALDGPISLAISPEGKNVYVAAGASSAVAAFSRSTADGSLTQMAGTAGCVSATGSGGACTTGRGLSGVSDVKVSNTPDGVRVYTAARQSSAIGVFLRYSTSGMLQQYSGTKGCVSAAGGDGCATGRALDGVSAITLSPDDAIIYASSSTGDALAVFEPLAGGGISQKSGRFGCLTHMAVTECTRTIPLLGAARMAVSPDGRNLYVAAIENDAVTTFGRDIAPQTTITAGPEGLGNTREPEFSFASNEPVSHYVCYFDSLPWKPCSGPDGIHRPGPVADGPHTFAVAAVDFSGNRDTSPAVRHFRTDATPPQITITRGTTGFTSARDQDFRFAASKPAETWLCSINGLTPAPCSETGAQHASHQWNDLPDGRYTIRAEAIDQVGNRGVAERSFQVDTTPPETKITQAPSRALVGAAPQFSFEADEPGATFECRVGTGPFTSCTAEGHHSFTTSQAGDQVFSVRATDRAGNIDPTPDERRFNVVPPDPPIEPYCDPAELNELQRRQADLETRLEKTSHELTNTRSELEATGQRLDLTALRIKNLEAQRKRVRQKLRTAKAQIRIVLRKPRKGASARRQQKNPQAKAKRLQIRLRSIQGQSKSLRAQQERLQVRTGQLRVRIESATALVTDLRSELEQVAEAIEACRTP